MTKYLLFEEEETPTPTPTDSDEPTPTPSASSGITAWVMGTVNYVNLREAAGTEEKIITTIPSGDEVTVLEAKGTWTFVRHGSATGYVLSRHLTYGEPLPSIGVVYVNTQEDPLTMRAEAKANGTIVTRVPRGEPMMLLKKLDGWYHVQYGTYVGYCSSQYLSFRKPSEAPDDTAIYDPTLAAVTGWTATVGTEDSMYQWCSMQSPELATLAKGASVKLLEKGDIWCKITYEGETGYCLTKRLNLTSPE